MVSPPSPNALSYIASKVPQGDSSSDGPELPEPATSGEGPQAPRASVLSPHQFESEASIIGKVEKAVE